MGSLFAEQCKMTGETKSRTLVEFKPHRFMGLTKVIMRILEKWDQLVVWIHGRIAKALRVKLAPPEGFPLAADKLNLIQFMCLLEPITVLSRRSQSESANQIQVLLTFYKLRQNVLNTSVALLNYRTKYLNPLLPYLCNVVHEGRERTCFQIWHLDWRNGYNIPRRLEQEHAIRERGPAKHPGKKRRRRVETTKGDEAVGGSHSEDHGRNDGDDEEHNGDSLPTEAE
ncbi:Hypothetical protein PHPALM_8496 [Phytophthora palmivora]|uniref:Uncharacterized protein n=1 Tax=Phytophthora palmivora TaxID=4796 RepID=A0A2P4Y9P5_9STRA|nr:Hypothetical protein PHPALM_8496 [Phytophthora palmivora]